ncbi:alpha/beta hydrolase [Alkalihalobacillus pseudalcaliphilus]|uniref:alpha/beta hydrolase n=1 Tax=Alkalihalobacillus pseudalcaliphilus TaxID=79884 RepID=UPI00069E523F|nr:alpha/beta hydrolase [Alkalihalobacillus pseudalcaliphilus]
MVRIVQPKPLYLKGKSKAVLLLHSFTSTNRDVKKLSQFLNEHEFSCYAPIYKGHGMAPEELAFTGITDWWESVEEGYKFLKNKYSEVAVIGISLGGIFALNVGQCLST